ncbi:MAG: hypothetical protein ABR987_05310 [Terracidiphilus sp.]|jgi:hypothetical protein
MLANYPVTSAQFGSLSREVQKPASFRYELLDFISNELPRWRDRPDRPAVTGETALTSLLCAHLNSTSRHSDGWDILQFRVEEQDDRRKDRKVDLAPAPSGCTISIEGRIHTEFNLLMPIECKRLPIPNGKNRDEREYVISRYSSTGGIQRFKEGHHGANHTLGAVIAYVQEETRMFWHAQIADWINDLISIGQAGWTLRDQLGLIQDDHGLKLAILRSSHARQSGLPEIELRHLWISMN